MTSIKKIFSLMLLSISILGCSAVTSEDIIGEKPANLNSMHWDGAWTNGEFFAVVKVLDASSGIIKISWLNPEKVADDIKPEFLIAKITEGKKYRYITFVDGSIYEEECPSLDSKRRDCKWGKLNKYLWARISHRSYNDQVIIWLPDTEAFINDVVDHKIQGFVLADDRNDQIVHLYEPGPILLDKIESESKDYFRMDQPYVFRKVE